MHANVSRFAARAMVCEEDKSHVATHPAIVLDDDGPGGHRYVVIGAAGKVQAMRGEEGCLGGGLRLSM